VDEAPARVCVWLPGHSGRLEVQLLLLPGVLGDPERLCCFGFAALADSLSRMMQTPNLWRASSDLGSLFMLVGLLAPVTPHTVPPALFLSETTSPGSV